MERSLLLGLIGNYAAKLILNGIPAANFPFCRGRKQLKLDNDVEVLLLQVELGRISLVTNVLDRSGEDGRPFSIDQLIGSAYSVNKDDNADQDGQQGASDCRKFFIAPIVDTDGLRKLIQALQ